MNKTLIQRLFSAVGLNPMRLETPQQQFHSDHYLRHNARRLEHLASLRIAVTGSSVLEVGAGIGDHSTYYLDRGCTVTITEAREENLVFLRKRFPGRRVAFLDMETPDWPVQESFDVVHCYGLLYHLSDPAQALDFLASRTKRLLLLETCVSFGAEEAINVVAEEAHSPSQAVSGKGCRPTRPWIFNRLKRYFTHVYLPLTQPNHEEFPIDWSNSTTHRGPLQRAVFVASRGPLANDSLIDQLIDRQERHA